MVTGPLDGVRVIDATRIIAGPMCALYLASLGAEVIRVEMPGGDLTWKVPPFFGPRGKNPGPRRDDEVALGTIKRNRGKRSMVLDLQRPAGQQVLHRLVETSDVFVENLRPGVMARLGAGYDELRARNPRLVYCSMTGYGQFGPYRDRQAMDVTVQAATGVQARSGFADGPPVKFGPPVGDLSSAAFGALGIVAALYQRDRTGTGQHIDIAMYDVLTSWLWDEHWDEWRDMGRPPRSGNAEPRGAPSNTYATADGWIAVLVTDDAQYARLCELIGRPDLLAYATNVDRVPVAGLIDAAITEFTSSRTSADAAAALRAVDVPSAAVEPPWAAASDDHAAARRSIVPLDDHGGRPTGRSGPRLPIHFSTGEAAVGPPETLGASTEAIARELGFRDDELAALAAAGAFG